MLLKEIGYLVLETIRNGHIVDDERLDLRLIYDWIDLKRTEYIKRSRNNNPNGRTNLNLYQRLPITVSVNSVTDAGDYPYANATTQLYDLVYSETIPAIMEDKKGPIIYSLESEDEYKLPFSFVDYDYLRVAGNGKFNSSLIFGSLRDSKIYFKYNSFFDIYTNVVLRAIFVNPRDVTGFNIDTSEYPADNETIEYIKNAIFDKDIKIFLSTKADEINDSSGELKE